MSPVIPNGKRAVIVGRNGTGKTQLGVYLARKAEAPRWVVINAKHEPAFADIGVEIDGLDLDAVTKAIEKTKLRFVIVNPRYGENAEEMDEFIFELHQTWKNIGLYVDELFSLQMGGKPGNGLTAWLTRGRSLRQSFIGCAQRPAWINKFVFSEADYFGALALTMKKDRLAMAEATGKIEFLANPPQKYHWRWYSVSDDEMRMYGPVPLFAKNT